MIINKVNRIMYGECVMICLVAYVLTPIVLTSVWVLWAQFYG